MIRKEELIKEPYESFANKIVLQAVTDYRLATKRVKKNVHNREAINEALRIERFFKSEWYQVLTNVDGQYLINKLQDELRQSE